MIRPKQNKEFLELLIRYYEESKKDYEKVNKSGFLSLMEGKIVTEIKMRQLKAILEAYNHYHKNG